MRVTRLYGLREWSELDFPHLAAVTSRLRDSVLGRIDANGAVRDPCRSRILESALTLRLLELTGTHAASRARLISYLERSSTDLPFDNLLIELALHRRSAADTSVISTVTSQAPGFTSGRKREFLQALFRLWDLAPAVPPQRGHRNGLHLWAQVQMTAVNIIMASDSGRLDLIADEDVCLLLQTQRHPWVWEGNVLINLWILHALARLPGTAAVLAEGLRKVMGCQRPDGGMPFVTDVDTWSTAVSGLALAATGASTGIVDLMIGHLIAQQRPGGGWTYTDRADQTDVDDTSVCVQLLSSADSDRYRSSIMRGVNSLLAVRQERDGGFPTYVAGAPSEASMTVAVMDALTAAGSYAPEVSDSALDFIRSQQEPNGSYPPDWSASPYHTLFRTVLLTGRSDFAGNATADDLTDRALCFIKARQNNDGGWGHQPDLPSDALSTAYALIACCRQDDPKQAMKAYQFLKSVQRHDGGIDSVADSIGPRPFVFSVPALADAFSLLALGHLSARMGKLVS